MLRTAVVALVLLVALVEGKRPKWSELDSYTFEQYIKDFDKPYAPGAEYLRREKIFRTKLEEVRRFNNHARASYKKGINHMSDWTVEERQSVRGRIPDSLLKKKDSLNGRPFIGSSLPVPHQVDYRNSVPPVLTTIKDQGGCGSCWAHAATEQIESHNAIATGKLSVLSQQQITSCTPNPRQCGGSGGCNGATAEIAFDYVIANGGITQEWNYGYSSYYGASGTCLFNASIMPRVAKLTGYVVLDRNSAGAVKDALAHVGPLAISVEADTWGDYESGIFDGCPYSKNISMDHAVQLVGYGHDDSLNQDYWLVRNSWSALWGEDGFIRLARYEQEPCGWNVDWITNGGGCPGGPNTVWACGTCGLLYDSVYPLIDTSGN